MDHVQTIVIGAGVVGLAIARKLAQNGREVLVIEEEASAGTITSSRNSGVIHAGIYYAPSSLKAGLCVKGRDLLYSYARERELPHRQCGKLIVATTPDQVPELKKWQERAIENGVGETNLITADEARILEPEVFCLAALHIPITGIIDTHPYILSLEADLQDAGGVVAFQTKVEGGSVQQNSFVLDVKGAAASQISCDSLINAAGLGAQNVALSLAGFDRTLVPSQVLAKGNYFSLVGKQPFTRLIYPLPVLGSSGLHAFCDLGGRVRFGPDVEWVDGIDYTVDPSRASLFEEAIRRYWPSLPDGALQPDYAGIRPKIAKASPHDTDFIIQTSATHKIRNLIQLYGIESPGLTSSLAIGAYVASLLETENG